MYVNFYRIGAKKMVNSLATKFPKAVAKVSKTKTTAQMTSLPILKQFQDVLPN